MTPSFPLLLGYLVLITSAIATEPAWQSLVQKLENTDQSTLRSFQLRDDKNHGLDCLEVFQVGKSGYHGVSHHLENGVFSIHLSQSTDLKNWVHLRELDQHASQATVHQTRDGAFLMAYEKDAPNSCWIRIRHYPDLASFTSGRHSHESDIPRTLAPTAEGTPSFEKVEIKDADPTKSQITLRFHYYKNARVDQLAHGTLTHFKEWKASPASTINQNLIQLGGHGNLGDRSKFTWKGSDYYLQEVQGTRNDWGTWGIFLCDDKGLPLKRVAPVTPGKSTAFSNPAVTTVKNAKGNNLLVFTAFLHRKGSAPNEAGQMLVMFPELQ